MAPRIRQYEHVQRRASFSKRADDVEERRGGPGVEKSHHQHRRLLRARRERPCGSREAEQHEIWITGKSLFDSASVLSTSHTQRSELIASGDTTNTTVSDCSIRPPRRASQGSPGAMSWGSRKGAKPATSSPISNAAESLRE